MSATEMIGFFWVVLAAGVFTAEVLIAAGITLVLGGRTLYYRYKRGQIEEEIDKKESE